ncbi:YybH family protein [Confluentibacter citreus]|uniref:YybH family protein n=1 Tax=Confluentibacter citreus TaxID=2007307 RepID=UPI000C2875F7|nr:nuclear transport factor 2 family protein [Confluentibacter citreus]
MKKILLVLFILSCYSITAQTEEKDKKDILAVLKDQRLAWSKDDIEGYMEGYWKNDSLKFYGANGIIYGWNNTYERYRRSYPDIDHTGTLSYKINDISKISDNNYYVLGEYHLKRNVGNADGFFMLLFRKIDNDWKIIVDTSY